MNIAALLIVLRLVFSRTTWVAIANNVFSLFIFPVDGFGWAGVVVLLVLSDALSRRKRFAWWVSLVVFGLMWLVAAAFFIIVVTEVFIGWPTDTLNDVDLAGYLFNVFSVGWILVALLTHRRDFAAHTVRANLGRAVVVLAGGLLATGFIGWLLVSLTGGVGRPRNRLVHIITRILQGSGAGIAQEPTSPHWVQGVVSFLLAVVLVAALVVILRSQRNIAMMSLSDELRLRRLLDENPADSLGYFALRRDKAVVFSRNGHAAVCYRTEAGVALASGDPVGPVDQWPGAIDAFLEVAHTYGWVPAVVGTSEEGATTWNQAGLRAMRIGDEAIISPATFNLDDPDLKPVRHTVTKLRAMGYTTRVRRHEDINPQELHSLIDLTDKWRQNGDERGFSMALSRLGDPLDGRCVMVEAIYPDDGPRAGQTAGILSFTPWGNDGLSLDVMRRDLDGADNGVTELMVAGLMAAGPEIGIRRVSMNFAVFREAIEEGARVGASPVRRLNRWLVLVASKWFQIEQLYRSNVKYKPSWQTRYLNFTDTSDLAQVGLAMGIAEGQLDIPNWLYPVEPPPQPIYSISGHPEIAEFLAEERASILPQRRLPEQVRTRMATRERLIESGVEAYPPDCKPDHRLGDVAVELTGQEMTVSGRVDACRDHGGVIFVDLFDWTGACQLVMERDTMGVDSLRDFRHAVSLGDHLVATGTVGASRNGTLSLEMTSWRLAAKSLRPLPSRRSGFNDPEAKVRQRYLDLIVNPSARDQLRARSNAIRAVRETLLSHDYIEVETPILQTIHGGANARPFHTHINAYDLDLYLRIAPELYLKRLMVGGAGRVFEIGRNFRNEGADATHNPEFTMLEAYQAYGDYVQMRHLTREMILSAARNATGGTVVRGRDRKGVEHEIDLANEWHVITVNEGISRGLGEEVTADTPKETLIGYANKLGIATLPKWSRGDVVLELHEHLSEHVTVEPTFFCDFPTDVSPLTRQHRDDPRLAEKWDLIIFGSEVGTAYTELVDPVIQRERFTAQSLLAAGGDPEAMELDEDFLEALEYAMPPSGGMGMGLDRLVMMLTNASIRETISFPLVRPRTL